MIMGRGRIGGGPLIWPAQQETPFLWGIYWSEFRIGKYQKPGIPDFCRIYRRIEIEKIKSKEKSK